ncbi:porin [Hyphomicrobium sp.]|uniref:porin n=1 Tax=Hyphomicrobium sp. TaxID=82 RepID=UPI0025BA5794|nr:porin [Hyphomicrobium sp.]MCC7252188.1 porin [Hyphomicrobium sp.]
MIGGTNKRAGLALGVIAGLAFGGATSASAADLGGGGFADLEERIAELEATTARKGNRKVSLTISGYVNEQIQWWDDGGESNVYQGTNESDQTRFRFLGKAKINADWSAGYLIEFGVWGERQGQFSANNDDTSAQNSISLRHSAWYLESATFGKLTVGQTSAPNDGITELTLAKTITVSKPIQIFTPNSGFAIRRNGSIAGNLTWGNLSPVGPGEGDRFNIVRYDTPVFAGFTASAAWGEDDLWSLALRYAGEFGGFKLAGGIGYGEYSDTSRSLGHTAGFGGQGDELGLSVSALHVATGLFATFAYGEAERFNGEEYENWHIQAGIQRKWVPLGATTLYGEYYEGDFGRAISGSISGPGGGAVLGSDVTVWGLSAVQSIDAAALDLYVSYRNYEADLFTAASPGGVSGVDEFQTVFAGAKISF